MTTQDQGPTQNPYAPPSADLAPPSPPPGHAAAGGIFAPYQRCGGAATVTRVFLYLNAAAAAGSGVVTALLASKDLRGLASSPLLGVFSGLAILTLLLLVGCAIAFCIWFHAAYRNLPALNGGEPTQHSAGWAPGSFFVPFLNLVRPHSIAREIWRCSNTDPASESWGIVNLWWALWLTGNILSSIGNRLSNSADTLSFGLWIQAFSELLTLGAALAAATVVARISARQERRAGDLGLG